MDGKQLKKRQEFFDSVKDGCIEMEKYTVELRKKKK
jgi:hypothetical protein